MDISECQNLFNTIQQLCYSNEGSSMYINFKVNKYLNYVSANGNTISCYVYDTYYNYTSECSVYINTSNNLIQYYNSGYYYTLYYGEPYEELPLTVKKNSPTSIVIYLGQQSYQPVSNTLFLSLNQSEATLQPGNNIIISLTAQESMNGDYNISFSCNAPSGISCSINPTYCITSSSCSIQSTISTSSSISPGSYSITYYATDNESKSASVTFTLNIQSSPSPSPPPSPSPSPGPSPGPSPLPPPNTSGPCLYQYNGQSYFFWGDINGNSYIPPIQNQGDCGDCWAFATGNGIISAYMIYNNQPNQDLYPSAYQLATCCNSQNGICSGNQFGCNGGTIYYPLLYAQQYGLSLDNEDNKYDGTLASCTPPSSALSYSSDVCGYTCQDTSNTLYYPQQIVPISANPNNTTQIKYDLMCYGPLVIGGYLGEGQQAGHATLLVGFNDNSQTCQEVYGVPGCWIIENQWGDLTACILIAGDAAAPDYVTPQECAQFFQNPQQCTQVIGQPCIGVYWMKNGYLYVPYASEISTPYGSTFPSDMYAVVGVNT